MRVVKCKRSRRWPSPAGFAPRLLRPQCATFMRKAFVIQRKTLPIALLRECFTPDFDLGTLAEAAAVRKEAEVLHDFHQNHGRTQ